MRGVGDGRVLRVTGVDRVQQRIGDLIAESQLPELGAPRSDSYEGEGYLIVRHPDTEVVTAAMTMITETIKIEYG